MNTTLEKDTILKRTNGIQLELEELKKLATLPFAEFSEGNGYKLAQYHLHRALEGVFNIAAHILSRIPGAQATTYKDTALKLGEFNIVEKQFAENNLAKMANYRNRLVHFYAEITPQELYDLLHNNLGDFDIFFHAVKALLENPAKFGLTSRIKPPNKFYGCRTKSNIKRSERSNCESAKILYKSSNYLCCCYAVFVIFGFS